MGHAKVMSVDMILLVCAVTITGFISKIQGYEKQPQETKFQDYIYQDSSEFEVDSVKGQRLIGAKASQANEFPFVGAYFWYKDGQEEEDPLCTSSLISESFAVISAHCFFDQTAVSNNCTGSFRASKNNSEFKDVLVICEPLESGDLKMKIDQDRGWQWYLLFDSLDSKMRNGKHVEGKKHEIDYIIRHKNSYDNKLEPFGYDIALIKLMQGLKNKPTCLPGLMFQDTLFKTTLVGYGNYQRNLCLTNSQGPMKSHYCKTEPSCDKKNNMDKCQIQFQTHLKDLRLGCSPYASPASFSRICHFALKTGAIFSPNVDEIHLFQFSNTSNNSVGGNGRFLETCYRNESLNGWCRTDGNYYDIDNLTTGETEIPLRSDYGWGFCSSDCNGTSSNDEKSGMQRTFDDADALPEAVCQKFLNYYQQKKNFNAGNIHPINSSALCIGQILPLRYKAYYTMSDPESIDPKWKPLDKEFFVPNWRIIDDIYRRQNIDVEGNGYYISSHGSCKGDSGGPSLLKGDFNGEEVFVLTGITSKGAIDIFEGTCGGVNNPTYYLRVRGLIQKWLMDRINGTEKVCVADQVYNFEQKLKELNETFTKYKMDIPLDFKRKN